jgi:hypothetical protein
LLLVAMIFKPSLCRGNDEAGRRLFPHQRAAGQFERLKCFVAGDGRRQNPFHRSLPGDRPHCAATSIVAGIMPQALRSGKPPPDPATTQMPHIPGYFRKTE